MYSSSLPLIPLPGKILPGEGTFLFSADVSLEAEGTDPALQKVAEYGRALLFKGKDAARGNASERSIRLCLDPLLPTGAEGYTLVITPRQVVITGKAGAGVFYGLQTLRQMLPAGLETAASVTEANLPALTIWDEPRFAWRGAMLDVCRHLFPVERIKRFLDLMALHKLNVFHWHLTEDQGWRIEIKKYPKLTEVGAWRGEGTERYGGFFTQDQVREIVAYAAERFITIVPEIEMPGHSSAAIAAYPEFGNHDILDYAPIVQTRIGGIHYYTYSPREETFGFLQDVLTEVMALFPGSFIHIGGDEAPKDQWKQSAFAQEVIQREGVGDENGLQSWFIRRIERFLNANGRKLIGWDEIQEGGLSPTASMMVWRDWKWARHAIECGNTVVMSPGSHCYLDHVQDDQLKKEDVPPNYHFLLQAIPIEQVYALDPVPPGLTPAQEKLVLGAQANLWTERMPVFEQVEYMAFPRLCALAEVAWSPAKVRQYDDFTRRLNGHLKRLDALGVNYWKPER